MKIIKLSPENQKRHIIACENQQDTYIDENTGYHVMTQYYLKKRGYCCDNQCRHCPYGDTQNDSRSSSSDH